MGKKKKLPTFPESVRADFEDAWQDVVSVHAKWKIYQDFYHGQGSVEAINNTVPGVFQVLEECLRNDIVMGVGRLLDPARTTAQPNMSLERLVTSAGQCCNARIRKEWKDEYDQLKGHAK